MKRETMDGLRSLAKVGRWGGWMPAEMAQDILDELKRLRRRAREHQELVDVVARYTRRERADVDVGEPRMVADWEFICKRLALKKGGRK